MPFQVGIFVPGMNFWGSWMKADTPASSFHLVKPTVRSQTPTPAAQPAAAAERAPALAAQPPAPAALEEVRRQARQAWLQMRATPPPAERAPELQRAAQLGATATATAEPPGQDLTL